MIKKYILVSESTIGSHLGSSNANEVCHTVALTFPPSVEKNEESYSFKVNLSNNRAFKEIVSLFFEDEKNSEIIIGYDDDIVGEAMATALRDNLLYCKIRPDRLRRVPLTYEGYIVVKEFSESQEYKEFIYLQDKFSSLLRERKVKKNVGFTKAFSLKTAIENAGKVYKFETNEIINTKASATVTAIVNGLRKG